MRAYADTSFLVKLVTDEADSEEAMAEFRRLSFPRLFYVRLHALEITNAIRQRAFHRRQTSSKLRSVVARERDTALDRVANWLKRGWLTEADADCESAFLRACELSKRHTERLGCRSFDLLHVAYALELECEVFLTADTVQAELARAEGFDVRTPTGR